MRAPGQSLCSVIARWQYLRLLLLEPQQAVLYLSSEGTCCASLASWFAMLQWPAGKKAELLCFLPSTEGEVLRLTPADPNERSGEVAKSLEAVLGSE